MFDLYDFLYGGYDWFFQYPAPRALTANQMRVKRIKRKSKNKKMLATKKGKRRTK